MRQHRLVIVRQIRIGLGRLITQMSVGRSALNVIKRLS